jgi:ubiquinone/menaquinone biosynthesis C-methylase UbiE
MFQDGMHSLSRHTAAAAAGALDLSDAKMVLDVGGGTGAYAVELAEHHPHLNVTVFDIEPVCEKAKSVIGNSSVTDRVAVVAGDFFEDELPAGFDTIILSMILHDWSPDDCRRLLRACAGVLPSGGRLIISELLVDDDKSGPVDAALMSLNMLVRTWGRNYTAAEYSSWLVEAGFHAPRRIPLDGVSANGLLVAERS